MSHNLVQLRRNRDDKSLEDNALQRLKHVMHDKRQISPEDIVQIARDTRQPEAAVLGVATYYQDLGLARRGRTRVKVCRGTACFATSGEQSTAWMEEALGLKCGETRADGSVGLEEVYCLGFCNAGPSVEVEGRIYTGLTKERARALAADLAGGGGMAEATTAGQPSYGLGFTSIDERMRSLRGRWRLSQSDMGGVRIEASFPISADGKAARP